MIFDQIIKLLNAITPLLQVLIWPIIILFLWRAFKIYVEDLRKDKNVSEMGFGVGPSGLNLNFKKQVNVATSLVQDNVVKQVKEGVTNPTLSSAQKDAIVDVVSMATHPATAQRIAGAKVLWVDDHPENNLYPRKAMEELGIQITLSTSTEDALEKIHSDTYDVIISDMGRQPPNPQAPYETMAGYDLLDKLRAEHINTPFIIYAGSRSPEHQKETQRHGGFGTTNNAQELLQMVINAIQQG
jgi:CheY-like chemotaxis protein